MEKKVFISVGKRYKPEQEKFLDQLQALLVASGVTPVIFGKTAFSSKQPLLAIKELMSQCDGTMILAFERVHIKDGTELRGGDGEKGIASQNLPTAWNQVEASMAYALGHPLFMVAEHGLRSEGLIEKGYDWWVQWVHLNNDVFADNEFASVLKDWLARVQQHTRAAPVDPEKMSIGDWFKAFGRLKPAQVWTILGVVGGLIALIFKAGAMFGK